jgi:glucokinase
VYLIGGVTNGVRDYLLAHPEKFLEGFRNKGRLNGLMGRFRVMVVNGDLEVGLMGAEEKARREMMK